MIVSHLLNIVELWSIRNLDLIELSIYNFEVGLVEMRADPHHIIGFRLRMNMIPRYCQTWGNIHCC